MKQIQALQAESFHVNIYLPLVPRLLYILIAREDLRDALHVVELTHINGAALPSFDLSAILLCHCSA